MNERTLPLIADMVATGRALIRLMRFDPNWHDGLEVTSASFLRSFVGMLLGLPFSLAGAMVLARATGDKRDITTYGLVAALAGYLVNGLVFPLLVGLAARPLGIRQGYAGFIIVFNWAALFLSILVAASTLLVVVGGVTAFTFANLVIWALSLFTTWRAAKETLTGEIGITLLMVVLSVAVGAGSDQLTAWLEAVL